MTLKNYLLLAVTLSIVLICSCNESTFDNDPVDFGYEYFPLELGNEWIYQVDSTVITSGGSTRYESTSFVKETITEAKENAEKKYILTRSSRKLETSPWKITDVYTVERDEDRAYRVEDNRRFIKLVFPVRDGKSWDGNVFFNDDVEVDALGEPLKIYFEWDYDMSELTEAVTIGDQTYTDVVQVDQKDSEDALLLARSYEQYAEGSGLIFKHQTYLTTSFRDSTIAWLDQADKGFVIEHRLLSFN